MRNLMTISTISFLIFLIYKPGIPNLQESLSMPKQEIGIIEHLGEYAPLDLLFVDENGDSLVLNQLIIKPTVVSLVYFNCPGICSPLLSGVVDVLDRMDMKPGVDYQAVTISFDPTDTPELAAEKKRNYLKAFRRGPFPEEHWRWLTGDSISIDKFTEAVGFRYKKEGRDFIHAGALIVLGADGKISRYLRGIEFQPFDLKMAITEASEGRTGPTITKVLLYCFSFDPAGKKYVFNFTKVGGTVFLVLLVVFIAFLTIKKQSQRGKREVSNGE
ncbi:MAG: SCO family protein [Calditrichae bacterium]|nr:SCO family protein [Calditrichia bacterium]